MPTAVATVSDMHHTFALGEFSADVPSQSHHSDAGAADRFWCYYPELMLSRLPIDFVDRTASGCNHTHTLDAVIAGVVLPHAQFRPSCRLLDPGSPSGFDAVQHSIPVPRPQFRAPRNTDTPSRWYRPLHVPLARTQSHSDVQLPTADPEPPSPQTAQSCPLRHATFRVIPIRLSPLLFACESTPKGITPLSPILRASPVFITSLHSALARPTRHQRLELGSTLYNRVKLPSFSESHAQNLSTSP